MKKAQKISKNYDKTKNAMANVKINYAHICDMAFLSQGGKANVIGIFKNVFSKNFPASHPKFSVIVSVSVDNMRGAHEEKIKIFRKSDQKMIGPEIKVQFNIQNDQQELNFMADIVNIIFEKPDEYEVKIFFDEEEIHSVPFQVIQSKDGIN